VNVGRLLSIHLGGLFYIVAIYLVLIMGHDIYTRESHLYEKEQWSLWLPDHLIMLRQ
jgi:hypothetical protein